MPLDLRMMNIVTVSDGDDLKKRRARLNHILIQPTRRGSIHHLPH
jgi:hypothetical protein